MRTYFLPLFSCKVPKPPRRATRLRSISAGVGRVKAIERVEGCPWCVLLRVGWPGGYNFNVMQVKDAGEFALSSC